MLFSNRKNVTVDAIDIKIDESIINRVSECKFLGTIKEGNLTWKPHINLIKQNIKKYWNHV